MRIIQLKGGLGNQLFQIALYSNLNDYYKNVFLNGKLCPELNNQAIIKPQTISHRFLVASCKILPSPFFNYITDYKLVFTPINSNNTIFTFYDGYWQSPSYFNSNTNHHIKHLLDNSFNGSNEYLAYLKEIKDSSISVSIHIRRGDYVTNKNANKIHGVLPSTYYFKAIDELKLDDCTLFIFSDDINWCKRNLNLPYRARFVQKTNSLEDFQLMSHCNHNIIANSSFSWWAAWLNQNPNKKVISPIKWFVDPTLDTSNLYPKEWRRV